MEKQINETLDDFLSTDEEKEFQKKIDADKKKFIKSDKSIIERVDKIIIAENGKQLLREVY
jgi:hypothetical protein